MAWLPIGALGIAPASIDDVVCTHLHADHCGWLFDAAARPVFANARIWFGAADWDNFVLNPDTKMFGHIRRWPCWPVRALRWDHGRYRFEGGDVLLGGGRWPERVGAGPGQRG
ncbi:MAG TPA: MBL fold metallo-hydrolase [Streptosporangiaceae bacterium]